MRRVVLFRASLCTLRQFRIATCFAGFPFDEGTDFGAWHADPIGQPGFYATSRSACSSDGIGAVHHGRHALAYCCAEWPRY